MQNGQGQQPSARARKRLAAARRALREVAGALAELDRRDGEDTVGLLQVKGQQDIQDVVGVLQLALADGAELEVLITSNTQSGDSRREVGHDGGIQRRREAEGTSAG